jgi:DNA repair photolyase
VDALVAGLFERLLDAGELGAGFRVVGWDAEQGPTLVLAAGEDELAIELGPRSDRPSYGQTRRFNLYVRDPFAPGRTLSDPERALIERVRAEIAESERRLPVVERGTPQPRVRIREIVVDRVLMREGHGQYYLNPYAGCLIGCPFCFVDEQADLSRALDGEPRQRWGRWLDVKVNAPEVLAREVRETPPGIVRMSPILTDPYQPIERHYRVTRRCLEVLCDAGFTPAILTRARGVLDDLALLRRFPRALVGLSIPTDDDRVRRAFEPAADPIETRIRTLAALRDAGIRTFAVVQPILPMNPEKLVEMLAPLVHAVRVDRLYFVDTVARVYESRHLEHMAGDAWIDATRHKLVSGFERYGVTVSELDRLAPLL